LSEEIKYTVKLHLDSLAIAAKDKLRLINEVANDNDGLQII